MSTRISVQEAQTQLPQLIARAAQDAEPCYIESNGKAVAVARQPAPVAAAGASQR
jgi:PHD/YefM family antitoxin component YafN of YafNO toxin-antitoxin module